MIITEEAYIEHFGVLGIKQLNSQNARIKAGKLNISDKLSVLSTTSIANLLISQT